MKHVFGVMSAHTENPSTTLPIEKKWFYAIGAVALTVLTAVAAKVAVPLPGTPVPGTLQTLPVLLSGLLLGARFGVLSQAAYLGLGLAGLPVFALPGAGPAYFLGPTGGYLLGFLLAPWIVGSLAGPARHAGFLRRLLAVTAGIAAIHATGIIGLSLLGPLTPGGAFRAGSLPFIGFDLAKGIVACALAGAAGSVSRIPSWTASRSSD